MLALELGTGSAFTSGERVTSGTAYEREQIHGETNGDGDIDWDTMRE